MPIPRSLSDLFFEAKITDAAVDGIGKRRSRLTEDPEHLSASVSRDPHCRSRGSEEISSLPFSLVAVFFRRRCLSRVRRRSLVFAEHLCLVSRASLRRSSWWRSLVFCKIYTFFGPSFPIRRRKPQILCNCPATVYQLSIHSDLLFFVGPSSRSGRSQIGSLPAHSIEK